MLLLLLPHSLSPHCSPISTLQFLLFQLPLFFVSPSGAHLLLLLCPLLTAPSLSPILSLLHSPLPLFLSTHSPFSSPALLFVFFLFPFPFPTSPSSCTSAIHGSQIPILCVICCFLLQSMLGTLLCLGQKNEGLIPLNKNLW